MAQEFRVDPENALAWVQIAQSARFSKHVLAGVCEPAEGSNFAQVNALYPTERASDWHRSYLDAALQHLLLWADYVAPFRVHPEQVTNHTLRPAYTLGRAAIEAASQAVWMTAEPTVLECVRRHLSLVRWDYEEHRKSLSGAAAKRTVQEADRELLDRVGRHFDERDLTRPGHLDVLRWAAPVIEIDPGDLERVWRSASGAAHGKRWPSLALQSIVPLDEFEPGQHRTVSIPDANGMTEVLRFADRMVTYGVLRHADLCGADIPRLLGEARRWLIDVVPIADDADPAVIAHLNREDD